MPLSQKTEIYFNHTKVYCLPRTSSYYPTSFIHYFGHTPVFGTKQVHGHSFVSITHLLNHTDKSRKNRLPYLVNSTIALTSPLTERETMKPSSI